MAMTRRDFQACLLGVLGSALWPGAWATAWVEDRDWQALPVPAGNSPGPTVKVREFFSYGCPHCAALNPLITAWARQLPADVEFQRVPVTFGRTAWTSLARLYYALEIDGSLARLDQAVFAAVGKQRLNLYNERAILDWVGQQGLDAAAFQEILASFDVEIRLRQAQAIAEQFRVDAVPSIVVDERYRVIGDGGRGHEGQLAIAAGLIEQARVRRQAEALGGADS
jgi:protein dithiol oxidoreductase (disulfide-forming)